MKAKKLLLTILSAFSLLFLLAACKGKGTWDAKKTTYDGPDAKVTFTKIIPDGFYGYMKTVRYFVDITNKTESEQTVEDLLKGVIAKVKQGDKTLKPVYFLTQDGEEKSSETVNPKQKVTARIEYELKDQKLAVDMTFRNGEHFKLTAEELGDRADQEMEEQARPLKHEIYTAERAMEPIKTAPGKFNWTLKQYDDLKDDFDLKGDKLEDILKDHPTPLDKGMDDVALVLTYGNAKNDGPTVVLTFRVDSNDELRLITKEQTGLD